MPQQFDIILIRDIDYLWALLCTCRDKKKKLYTISFLSHDEVTPKTNIFITGDIVKYLWRMVGSLLQILVWNEMKYGLTDFSFLHIQEVKTLISCLVIDYLWALLCTCRDNKKTCTISFLSHDEVTPKTNIFVIVFSIPSLH
jgi:ABC-type uncharacterized transport system auxiliary subunit